MSENVNIDDRYVVGVDFGTLSGRALVVRVRRRRRGGHRGARLPPRRHRRTCLPATGAALPPDWALQDPDDYREVLRRAVPAAVRRRGHRPGGGRRASGSTSPPAPCCRRWPTARRCARCPQLARPAARLREAVEASRGPAQADRINAAGPRAGRAVDRPLRRQDLRRVAVRQGRCSCLRRTRRSTSGPSGSSRRLTGSSGSCAARRPATSAPPATRGSIRTAATRRRTTWPR